MIVSAAVFTAALPTNFNEQAPDFLKVQSRPSVRTLNLASVQLSGFLSLLASVSKDAFLSSCVPATPVPERLTISGELAASVVMVTVPGEETAAVGENLTLILQPAPGASVPAPVGQVLLPSMLKGALARMLVKVSSLPPVLVRSTVWSRLVVPTSWLPKESEGRFRLMTGAQVAGALVRKPE